MIAVRPAAVDDLPTLAAYWHEKWTLLSQADRRVRLAPDARAAWIAAAQTGLNESHRVLLVAEDDERVIGYVVGRIELQPGLLPERLGVLTDIALDMHGYHAGAARALVEGLRAWFAARGVTQMMVWTPRRQPVEQAFWRALGAAEWMDGLWLKQ